MGSGGDAAGDMLFNIESLYGSNLPMTLSGDDRDNIFAGGEGADTLIGGAGNDYAFWGWGRPD